MPPSLGVMTSAQSFAAPSLQDQLISIHPTSPLAGGVSSPAPGCPVSTPVGRRVGCDGAPLWSPAPGGILSSIRVAQTPPNAPSLLSAPSKSLRLTPLLLPIKFIPPQRLSILCRASSTVLGVPVPRDFQLVAAHHLAFDRGTLLVVNLQTADGKTLATTLPAFLCRGMGVFLVPLVGLGSDQVKRATVIEHSIQPYHITEHKGEDAALLITRLSLLTMEESKWVTVKLFLGPKVLSSQKWGPELEKLARKGVISLFCIDKAHEVEQSGRFFRPEFKAAVAAISRLVKMMPVPVPRVLLSATLRQRDVDVCRVRSASRQYAPQRARGST